MYTHVYNTPPNPQAVIHCEIIRQAARVVAMDREHLRSGDRARIRWRFIQHPEWLQPGTRWGGGTRTRGARDEGGCQT